MINRKRASPLVTLALASAVLAGCKDYNCKYRYEAGSEIANSYDISLEVDILDRRAITIGTRIKNPKNLEIDAFTFNYKQPYIYAQSGDGDNNPESISIVNAPAGHPLRKLANLEKIAEIGDYLDSK